MKQKIKKSGRKLAKRVSRASRRVAEKSKSHVKEYFVGRLENVRTVRLWVLEWFLLVLAITLFAVVQSMWYRNSYETEVFASGGTYVEGVLGKINSMNPLYATTSAEKTLARLLFANLLTPDTSGNLGNDLAAELITEDDGKVWIVKLKSDLKWSDGEAVTADDVLLTVKLLKDPTAKTTVGADFSRVEVEKIDDLTVKFTLPVVYAAFADSLDFPIVPEHLLGNVEPALVYENDFSKNPVGTGAFKLNALQAADSGQTAYLTRNSYFWRGEALLNSFTLKTYNSEEEIAEALNKGEIMGTADLDTLSFGEAEELLNGEMIYERETPLNGGIFAFLNTTATVLSDVRVRQAISKGVDMSALRQGLVEDWSLDYPILSRQMDLEFPELNEYSVTEAEQLLADVGWKRGDDGVLIDAKGERIQLVIAVAQTGDLPELARRLASQLNVNLGFETIVQEFVAEEASQDFFTAVVRPRSYDVLVYEVDLGLDPDPFAYYASSQATETGMNLSNYQNKLASDALLSARTTLDEDLRKAKYESFLKYWVRDVPALAIGQSTLRYYYNKSVRTFSENNSLTEALDRFTDVEYWATNRAIKNRTP